MSIQLATNLSFPDDAITQKFAWLGQSGGGKTYGAGKFVEGLLHIRGQVVILDRVGIWYGLRLVADGKSRGLSIPVFGGDHGDIPLDPTAGSLVADVVVDKGISVVLDIHQFRKTGRKQFVTDFAEQLFHRKKGARSPIHLVIEEAQAFVPQKTFKGEERMLGAFEDLCKLGRNYGIGYSLISQRPQAVNKDVLNQTGTLMVFNMTGPQERKTMEGWIVEQGSDVTKMVHELPSLPTGTAYIWSPKWIGTFQKIKISKKSTFDSSATPKFGTKQEKAKTLAPVDLEQIQTSMQATIEKAKASDPKELQKTIASLQAQIRQLENTQPHDKIVEVPVPVHKEWQTLSELCRQFQELSSELQRKIHLVLSSEKRETNTRCSSSLSSRLSHAPIAKRIKAKDPAVSNHHLPKAERLILTAIAQRHPEPSSRIQIFVLSGYSIKSSGFANALGSLRSSGYIDGRGDSIQITSTGFDALGPFEPAPGGSALIAWWTSKLPKAERIILDIVTGAYPNSVTKEDVSEASGYSITSSGFANALSKLRSLQLIVGRGEIRASEAFF